MKEIEIYFYGVKILLHRLESAASTYMVCDLDVMILIIIPG